MSTTAKQQQHNAERELRRQQRLHDLLSSIPHIKRASQVFDEAACERATEAAQRGCEGQDTSPRLQHDR